MSMYTQLLTAAVGQGVGRGHAATRERAVAEVRRCHEDLIEGVPAGTDPDAVPAALAQQIAYDVALITLAVLVGIETDPSRFEQPEVERRRIDSRLAALGIVLVEPSDAGERDGSAAVIEGAESACPR